MGSDTHGNRLDGGRGPPRDPVPGDDAAIDSPPAVAPDERRMQVRAYNAWTGLLDDRSIPPVSGLDPAAFEFSSNAVLLEFSGGKADPPIRYLGDRLAKECGARGAVRSLGDIPPDSLLARIADNLSRVLADRAPLGFEAEYVNPAGATLVCRGILLPFSTDERTIDFVYAVINWKERADQATTDTLLRELGVAQGAAAPLARRDDRLTVWADGPAAGMTAAAAVVDRLACAGQLRALPPASFAALSRDGREFALLLARRLPTGEVVLVGEVPNDGALLDRAAAALLGEHG
jgi:hypothetical protein